MDDKFGLMQQNIRTVMFHGSFTFVIVNYKNWRNFITVDNYQSSLSIFFKHLFMPIGSLQNKYQFKFDLEFKIQSQLP